MQLRHAIAAAAGGGCLALAALPASASAPAVVRPGHLGGWTLATNKQVAPPYDASNLNSKSTAGYQFTDGPAKPPLGTGSLLMHTGGEKNSRVAANPPVLVGDTLGSVRTLRYATYLEDASTSGTLVPVNVKLAGTSAALGYATAVFEPANQSSKPATGTWQTWNALTGKWWTSKVTSGACSQSQPCAWTSMVGKLGAATRIVTAYFELGDSGTGFSGVKCALDDVTVNDVTYDFELTAPTAPAASGGRGVTRPGSRVTVHGTGFQPGEKVTATLHSARVATAVANGSGAVTLTFLVPIGTASGHHVIVLTGLSSGRTATWALIVTGGPETGLGGMARFVAGHHPAPAPAR